MKTLLLLCFISFVTARINHEKIWEYYRKDFAKNYSNTQNAAKAKAFFKKMR